MTIVKHSVITLASLRDERETQLKQNQQTLQYIYLQEKRPQPVCNPDTCPASTNQTVMPALGIVVTMIASLDHSFPAINSSV